MAPISFSVTISPVRVGFISTFSMTMSEPGTIRAATSGKPAEDGSPGTAIVRRELALAVDADVAHALSSVSTARSAPKPFSIFSVWSRVITGSITVVTPGVFKPASSTADFTWAEAIGTR